MEFSKPDTAVGILQLEIPSPEDLPHPGIQPGSPALQVDTSPTELSGKPQNNGWIKFSVSFHVAVLPKLFVQ